MKGSLVFACLAAVAAAAPYEEIKPTTTSCSIYLCADYVNSCGKPYGGCFPACPGFTTPTFSIPPCPSTSTTTTTKPTNTTKLPTKIIITRTPTRTPTTAPCQIICVDAINECGIRYGGCYCRTLTPPYTKPPCPSTTKTTKTTTTKTTTKTTKTTKTPVPTTTGPVKCGGLAGFQCPKGQTCIDDPKSPCGIAVDCLGICITEQFCGGFAGFPCPTKGDVCIDDPRDDCDPKNGGADCGGLCVPEAWTK